MTGAEKRRLDAYCAPYRKAEKRAQVATIADNEEALRVLAVWPACRSDWRPEGRAPRDEFERQDHAHSVAMCDANLHWARGLAGEVGGLAGKVRQSGRERET